MDNVRVAGFQKSERGEAIIFLFLTLVISSVFYALIIASGKVLGAHGGYVSGLMWSPALGALATIVLKRRHSSSLGLGRWDGRAALIAYLVPLGYGAIAYAIIWGGGLGGFAEPQAIAPIAKKLEWPFTAPMAFVPAYFILTAITGIVGSAAWALGEEIGWRGFLTPRLVSCFGFTGGSLLMGLIWGTWHMPILLFADYNSGTPWWFAMPCFYVQVIASAFMLTWLRLRSNSVWPCAIMHASHNLFVQGFFTPLTSPRGSITPYVIDEFGVLLPAAMVLVAFFFWTRRGTLTPGIPIEAEGPAPHPNQW